MKWSYQELQQLGDAPQQFLKTLDLTKRLQARQPDLIKVAPVEVKGLFSRDELGVSGYYEVTTNVTLPSSRSLKPVTVPLQFSTTEHYLSQHDAYRLKEFEDTDVVLVLDNDLLDLDEVICDNILLQLPMQVLAPDEKSGQALPDGEDWQVVSEGQSQQPNAKHTEIDPRLAKLKDFFSQNDNQ